MGVFLSLVIRWMVSPRDVWGKLLSWQCWHQAAGCWQDYGLRLALGEKGSLVWEGVESRNCPLSLIHAKLGLEAVRSEQWMELLRDAKEEYPSIHSFICPFTQQPLIEYLTCGSYCDGCQDMKTRRNSSFLPSGSSQLSEGVKTLKKLAWCSVLVRKIP